ncbi:extracellular solute-binding protein [Paenibacillus sp. F6_3S_P_1C]|uniref:Extracellular solute-binding protein n=1 Tax=Paenibacillus vandeheii TaxID=3035917 RepID=A0ABT8J567_9BACL|nr:extracellular solute-binding protein [Paenibacillus vandeheii]MDN4600201.1 extracellular solute-binding protein [Paenibacillus vandeheii]
MKKWMVSGMALLLVAAVMTGCNKGSGAASGESGGDGKTKFSMSLRTLAYTYVEKSPDINKDKWVKKLEDLTNTDLKIVLVPHKEYEQKMVQMFATNDIPDVVQGDGGVNGKEMAGSVEAGVFQPLDELLQQYGQDLLKAVPKEAWDQVTHDGHIYAIPEYLSNPSRRATWIRKDLLDQTGLPVPTTVEETMDVLRAFKKLGVENPYMGREDFKYADTFFGAYDVQQFLSMMEQQGDQIVPKFMDNENMQQALTVYKTMYEEGLINKEFATINSTVFKNTILSGKAGMWSMNANELIQWEKQIKASVPDAKIEIIPSPVGPDGKGGYYLYGPVTRAYFINKDAADPASIIRFFNWMVSDEAEKFFTYGTEGETYTEDNGVISYTAPTDSAGVDEERYRQSFLWFVQDTTYNKGSLSLTEEGRKLMNIYDTILAKEGRDGINFDPRLEAFVQNPDIAPNSDTPPQVLLTHMIKMVYGKEPISDWPKVVEEWKSKGGDRAIEEATQKFKDGEGVSLPRR